MQRFAVVLILLSLIIALPAGAQTPGADPGTKKLLAANGLFQRQLYKLAAEQYADFLKEHPAHREARAAKYALAICYYRMNDFAKASATLEEVLGEGEFAQRDEAMLVLGFCRLSLKDYQKSIAVFDELIAKFPDSPSAETAALNRSQALLLMGKGKEAAGAAQLFIDKYPQSKRMAEAMYFLALAQRAAGDNAEAARTLGALIDRFPEAKQRGDAMLALGQALESLGQHEKAIAQYEKLAESIPEKRAEAWYAAALAHYNHADYENAIKSLTRLIEQNADSSYASAARLQLGLTHLAARQIGEARRALDEVVQKDPQRAGTARYWLAQCDIAEKKYDSARATLDELARGQPRPANIEQILVDRAQCALGMGKYDQAAEEFGAFALQFPNSNQRSEAVYRQAFCLHKLANYARSLELCRDLNLPETHPLSRTVRELAAENLLMLNRHDEAVAAYDQLRKKSETDALKYKYTVRLAQAAYFGGDYAAAIDQLTPLADNRAVLADAELSRAILILGDALLHEGKNKEAVDILARYSQSAGTEKLEAQFKRGLALLRAGDTAGAEQAFADLSRESTDSAWTLRGIFEYGQLKYRQNDPVKASNALKKILAVNAPAELAAPASYLLAWIELDGKHPAEAAAAFAQVAEKYPKDALAADARFYRGVALKDAGDEQQAVTVLQDYLKDYAAGAHAAKARQLIAACLVKLQKHQEAIKTLTALAADPKTATDEVLYDLAWSQQSAKDVKNAEQTYRLLLNNFPQSKLVAPARSELAEILFQQEKFQEAADLLEKVIADNAAEPKTVSVALYRLGSTYEKLGQPAKAADTFKTFIDKHGNDELAGWAHYQAGVNLARQEKLDEAKSHFQSALAANPKQDLASVSLLKLAEVIAQQGDYPQSQKLYQQFLDQYAKDRFVYQAQFGIGWALENQKKYEEARQWYAKVIAQNSSPTAARAQFQIGETFFAQGQYEQAAAALLAVVDVYAYPEWAARATFEAGRVFEQLKQTDQARRQYDTVVNKYKNAPEAPLAQKRLAALDEK